ncbi:MAG: glycine cleavage system aminomethyltransferase GcvT [Solobacterium sp.]|jgi:aminomethyltransferase|nr:glycine cleavage system aminomethyltransferase GcvT [Solobacterium sp.]
MAKKTPLYDLHEQLGGKIVDFAGWLLPVQYSKGILEEHKAVRERVGLFDVSHMGEFTLKGDNVIGYVNWLVCNDISKIAPGKVRYSPLLNEEGGIVDDLLIYDISDTEILLVVNAANRDKDFAWIKGHLKDGIELEDISDTLAQIAIQGPKAEEVISKVCDASQLPVKYYTFTKEMEVAGVKGLVSRTGYTGEDGFECYVPAAEGAKLYQALLEAGKEEGIEPCGLGARDTLRLEASMPLYGHEMTDETAPQDTGLDRYCKMAKEDFVGKAALEKRTYTTTRIGLKVTDRGIAREHCDVYDKDQKIGVTTSGTFLPYLGGAYAMAIVEKDHSELGTTLYIDVRGRKLAAEVVALPFYHK